MASTSPGQRFQAMAATPIQCDTAHSPSRYLYAGPSMGMRSRPSAGETLISSSPSLSEGG